MTDRPSTFTAELAAEICRRLRETPNLRQICRANDMPPEATVRLWATEDRGGFAAQYARARALGYEAMADEVLEISDDSTGDWITEEDGEKRVDHENVQRSRLMVDTRKWLLSKVLPKVYGDKLALTNPDGGPLAISVVRYDVPALPGDGAKVIEHEACAHAPQAPDQAQVVDKTDKGE